ncbi:hypothetical protein FRB90_001857 [Tulasnella sp. 427]|nr:hypothetical protein FRB90_001857 [Tulasnella sp. 427]
MQSESTVTGRKIRNLVLSVFNPDNSSDEDAVPVQRNTPQTTAQLLPKPLPVPGVAQGSYFPQQAPLQQQLQSPYTARPAQRQPSHPIHSASSSTSSISISTSLSSQPGLQFPNGARHAGAQASPTSRYANASPLNYVGSSSSSRSSPAMDTTPPPTTPSNNLPPVNFHGGITDDRNLDGLGLDVASESAYQTPSSSNPPRTEPRNGLYGDYMKNLPPAPMHSANPSPAPTPKFDRRESIDKVIITVTADAENHVIVDISGAKDADFIRERMFSKLRIPDDDHQNYQIYRTELGEAALGDPVTDNQLMIYCGQWADAKGTLKFLVQRNPGAPPPQPHYPPSQVTATPHVQTPPAVPDPIPPLFSPAHDRRRTDNTIGGGASSAEWEQDRPPWDMSNGYDGDVDGSNRRRHQSPAPIDTSRRRREPSASGSDLSSFSPTSPNAPPSSMAPLIGIPTRRPQPSQLSNVAATGPYLNPNTPIAHRRRESDTAAIEREQAFELHERYQEAQNEKYDSQYKKGRAEKDRQARRQQQVLGGDRPMGSGHKAHRSESADSAPHGWVIVNEVFPTSSSNTGSDRYTPISQRGSGFGRSNTTGAVNEWAGSPPSDARFSPASATTPSTSRPYPHSTNTSYTATTPTLQRAHPPLPGTGKYPNPHPHPRTGHGGHAALPPGAIDPRMRQIERQQQPATTPAQFYAPSIAASYNPSPAAYNPPQQPTPPASRMLQPSGNTSGTDTGGGRTLRSPRSMSDLNWSAGVNSAVPPPTSHSSNQIPTLVRKPNALPSNSLLSDSLYNPSRQPTSPNRLPPSPSRPIINPTLLYNGSSGASSRTPGTPQDIGGGLPRSLGNAGLFSGGVFADGPLNRTPGLRPKPSSDRLNAVDRTMVPQQNRDQGPPAQGTPLPTPSASSSYRYGWLSNTSSPAPSRPNSGDVEGVDFNRPSPVEQSSTDTINIHEFRRPSLPMINVPSTSPDSSDRQPSPYAENSYSETPPTNNIPIPKAYVTPSSPIDPDSATMGVRLYDNPSPNLATSPALTTSDFADDASEGTLKPHSDRLLSTAGSDNDADEEGTGTMKPRAAQVTFSQAPPRTITAKAKRMLLRPAQPRVISTDSLHQQETSEDAQPNEEEHDGEEDEEAYSDSDSSEDDARFWNQSSVPSAAATPPAIKTTEPDDDESSTIGPWNRGRGPSLTLSISPLVDDRGSPMPTPLPGKTNLPSSRENSPSPSPAAGLTPTGGINRRASFRRDTWAFRPIQEDVLDHLQDFFPDHDLDKPFIDQVQIANEGLASPAGEVLPPPVPPPVTKETRFKHRKSIRFVAEERKKVLERVGSAREPSAKAANLGRKRSTKLWGIRVEEVTPGQVKSGVPPTIPESPTGHTPRPTIKWVKGELIGKGTYGRVFLAFNVTTGEMMAVKQVEMPQTISDQDDVRQVSIVKALESEQQTLEKLDHPNIVQYLGFEKTKEFFSVFLEYVPGGSIGSCLRRHGKFEENIIKSFTGQIIDGLAYLHANKIIHRDIKADNVLVDPSGNCKISDFGISKQSEEIYNNAAMTAMQGSLFWMAPEMLHNDKKGYNAKIDIWSLGCVFIEMFAGRRPWEQDDFVSVMFKVGRNKMAPPVPSDVHLSSEAEDFRLKCFTQDPAERPTAEGLKGHPWLYLPSGWFFPGFH